jgi:hypothetical protein
VLKGRTSAIPAFLGSVTRRVSWFCTREATLVILAGLAISVLFNWSSFRHPRSVITGDLGDPLLQTFELAWQHQWLTEGGDFWTTNLFHPSVDTLAFSDALVGYFPLGIFGDGMYDAVMRYNLAFLFAWALAFVGAYWLTRQLGANWPAAAFAGVVFAWAPWRLAHTSHLNILSSGGIALALFAIARGHGYSFRYGLRPEFRKPWWVFAGWVIAAWQVTLGFAIGIPFVYVMGIVGLVVIIANVIRRQDLGKWVLGANGLGIVVFLAVTYLMTIPYRRAADFYGLTRTWDEVVMLSPPAQGLVTASDQTWLWQDTALNRWESLPGPFPAESMLLPGFAVILFAIAGLIVSAWPWRVRLWLAIATAVAMVLSLGASVFGGRYTYQPLYQLLPGWDAQRTPGRLIVWASLGLALLAAGAITGLAQAWARRNPTGDWKTRPVAAALVIPAVVAFLEAIPIRGYATVPGVPTALRPSLTRANEPILILPADELSNFRYMLWSTEGFPRLANGHTGHIPPSYWKITESARSFPDRASIETLNQYGIRTVVVIKSTVAGTLYAESLTRDATGLAVERNEDAETVVFRLK